MSRTNEAIEQLLGIVSSMMADDELDDLEIEFLQVWLADNADVSKVWPGSAIARAIDTVLADGHVSEDERAYLMSTLRELAAAEPEAAAGSTAVPVDDAAPVKLQDSVVCLAGDFLHGTRGACERILEQAGAWPVGAVSRNVHYLVVGTKMPSQWAQAPDGRKIEEALALQRGGHPIVIISERRWLECAMAPGARAA